MTWPEQYTHWPTGVRASAAVGGASDESVLQFYGYQPAIILSLERLRYGCDVMVISNRLVARWREFRQWIPWNIVPKAEQYKRDDGWHMIEDFSLTVPAETGEPMALYLVNSIGFKDKVLPKVNFVAVDARADEVCGLHRVAVRLGAGGQRPQVLKVLS
ncbi:MAG TPA: hypothetical protein VLL52_06025 [Anaerolineae bacterium]|nr:hypothetical protein [Anaerolineae bacterium]